MSNSEEPVKTFLPGFYPLAVLWESEPPTYPSQQSALWAVRQIRSKLAAAGGIALHRGRTMIHLAKLIQIAEQDAIERAKRRYCGS